MNASSAYSTLFGIDANIAAGDLMHSTKFTCYWSPGATQ
jgi:hypothetical protein